MHEFISTPYYLALIVYPQAQNSKRYILTLSSSRGNTQQHILDQFSDFVRTPIPISTDSLRELFKHVCQEEVYVLTSELAGLGKTETIRRMAFSQRKQYVSLCFIEYM